MNEVDQEIQKSRKLIYGLIAFLLLTAALTFRFYREQKKENNALRIKILTLNKTRTITPWSRLISRPQIAPIAKTSTPTLDTVSTQSAATIRPSVKPTLPHDEQPVQNLSTTELANALNLRMIEINSLDKEGLDKNIEIADEIISREPDSYSAYKAKLISLLLMEGKLNLPVEDSVINNILETMATFELSDDTAIKREAILIRNASKEITDLTNTLNEYSGKRQDIEAEMEYLEPNSSESRAMEIERQNLLSKEEELTSKIIELNNELESGFPEDQYLNEDIVQIPFLRLMARNDYEEVIDNALTFIDQFPNSPDGYYFLIKAYELTGRNEDALRVNEDPRLSNETLAIVQKRLRDFPNFEPKKYWENLKF